MREFISTEKFATDLMKVVDKFIDFTGIAHTQDAHTIVYLIFVLLIAVVSGCVARWIIIYVVKRSLEKHFSDINKELIATHVYRRCGRMIPPLVLLSLIPFAFSSDHKGTHLIVVLTLIYTIVMTVLAINSVLSFIWIHFDTHRNKKNLPLRGILDITRGILWVVAVIVIVSLIIDKSPLALITGLGAFAAVLLLIFRNSILGLVAGIEMSDNDMLRVGDWISIPGTEVNGIVIDVSLVVVKVRNWNNTVSMVPSSSLIEKHFVNWRYMKETGSRQIEMSVPIDINTVRPLADTELADIQTKLPLLKDFIDIKLKQRAEGKTENVFNKETGVNGTIDTNLGLLRAYVYIYLSQHPYVYTEKMHMVRLLQPTTQGFPMQIFAYVSTADWPAYEAIEADIFEHITAVAPTFGLTIFEEPSGRSVFNVGKAEQANEPYNGSEKIYTSTPDKETNNKVGFVPE